MNNILWQGAEETQTTNKGVVQKEWVEEEVQKWANGGAKEIVFCRRLLAN